MPKFLILTNSNELVRIAPERIAYVTSDGNYSSMVLIDGEKHVFSFNLAAFEKIVNGQIGPRAHTLKRLGRRLIINGRYIHRVNVAKGLITLSDPSFSTHFTLEASKEALRVLKSSIEEEIRQQQTDQN